MSELFPAKTIAVEVLGCTDPTREGEFNRWYDKFHLRDLRDTPGIVDVYRYRDVLPDLGDLGARWRAPEGKPVRYLTFYRINGPDPWLVMQRVKEDDRKRAGEGQDDRLSGDLRDLRVGLRCLSQHRAAARKASDAAARRHA